MKPNIGENIKKLRTEKNITQEQLATHLSISYQSVSKWENNISTPDIFLLPTIAEYFETTIDELFKPNMTAYRNKADRLLAIYERTKKKEDFERANTEFERLISSGEANGNDLRSYGILNEYYAFVLINKSLDLFEKAIAQGIDTAQFQLLRFKANIGLNKENITKFTAQLETNPENAINWWLASASYEGEEMYDKALEICLKGLAKFPNNTLLLNLCGEIHNFLEQHEKAFACWQTIIQHEPNVHDTYYSMAFAYDELGEYSKSIEMWEKLDSLLKDEGFTEEREWASKEIKKLKELKKCKHY